MVYQAFAQSMFSNDRISWILQADNREEALRIAGRVAHDASYYVVDLQDAPSTSHTAQKDHAASLLANASHVLGPLF